MFEFQTKTGQIYDIYQQNAVSLGHVENCEQHLLCNTNTFILTIFFKNFSFYPSVKLV